jgi:hypothetical protein
MNLAGCAHDNRRYRIRVNFLPDQALRIKL